MKRYNQVLLNAATPTERALIQLLGLMISNANNETLGAPQSALITRTENAGYTGSQSLEALDKLAAAGVITVNAVDDGSQLHPFKIYAKALAGGGL